MSIIQLLFGGEITTPTPTPTPTPILRTVQYTVVGGGGGGGIGGWPPSIITNEYYPSGGGGAGGFLEGSVEVPVGVPISITIGSGGAVSANGSPSSFGSYVTALGGGRGGSLSSINPIVPQFSSTGGSGGGGGPLEFSGSAGTSGQGFVGGNPSFLFSTAFAKTIWYSGGGGGGAGGPGGDGPPNNGRAPYGGLGGPGRQSFINGITYGGGGAGEHRIPGEFGGIGGSGGGGDSGVSGTPNTGGGGGANASGGSGIIILRFSANVSSASGGFSVENTAFGRVYTWTSNGTIIFS